MVCFFCIAILTLVAGAIAASTVDEIEENLDEKAVDGVKRVADTESVARFELTVQVDHKKAPVVVTVYKDHARVRIQILTHDLSPEQIKRVQDELAEALEAEIVDRSSPDTEEHEDHEREADEEEVEEKDRERVAAQPGTEKEPPQPQPAPESP